MRAAGNGGGFRSRIQFSMRRNDGRSSDSGVAPAPIAALLFRSSTESLLPSQCSHIPCRMRWFQSDGRSTVPTMVVHRQLQQHLVRIERVDAAGPCGGRVSNQALSRARSRMPFFVAPMTNSGSAAGRATTCPDSLCGSPP